MNKRRIDCWSQLNLFVKHKSLSQSGPAYRKAIKTHFLWENVVLCALLQCNAVKHYFLAFLTISMLCSLRIFSQWLSQNFNTIALKMWYPLRHSRIRLMIRKVVILFSGLVLQTHLLSGLQYLLYTVNCTGIHCLPFLWILRPSTLCCICLTLNVLLINMPFYIYKNWCIRKYFDTLLYKN